MKEKLITLIIVTIVLLSSGCAISRNVVPVDSGVTISKVYILENEKVHMEGLVNEIALQIEQLGFESEIYQDDRPEGAKNYLNFTANWAWDMAMYLTYFKATLYEEGRVLGEVEYDSRMGGANLGKFGRTAEKIGPLLEELFQNVSRSDSY